MKNRFIKYILFSFIILAGSIIVSAQESTTLYFMKGVSQSDLLNPALHNDSSSVVIGLPGLSGMYFDANSGFAINDLIHKGTGLLADSLVMDIDRFHSALKSSNAIEQNFSIPLFYLGIRVKKQFFSFGITEKEFAQFTFAKSLVTFIKDGNGPYMGQNFDLGNIGLDAVHYREFAFGYSNELIKNKLTVGLKLKALYGKSAIQTERMNLKVETAADGSYLNLRSDMKVNLSMPATPEYDSINYLSNLNTDKVKAGDYLMQTGNFGMAFDLGAVYNLTPLITLSGSIIDMGKISFKKDLINIDKTVNYKWEGIDVSKSMDPTKADYVPLTDLFSQEADKMTNSFRPNKSEIKSESFDVSLPTKIYLGGSYQITNIFDIGLLDRLYMYKGFSKNSITLSGNTMLGNCFSVSGSYSMIGNSYNNLGLGMGIRLGATQLYMVSDNLLAMNPSSAEVVNFKFGMNFLFGRKHAPKEVVE